MSEASSHTMVRWIAGSDHAGLALKLELVNDLRALGDVVDDLGTHDTASVDYPHYGELVARAVVASAVPSFGLVVCGSGIGISIAANKVSGARCALVHDHFTATMARLHNDANLIAFGQRVIGVGVALECLRAFRNTSFEGGRHQRRVDQLSQIKSEGAR